jgi:hypothetical protein
MKIAVKSNISTCSSGLGAGDILRSSFDLKILIAAVTPVCHKGYLGQKIGANCQLELIS